MGRYVKHGLTWDEREDMFKRQEGRCAICGVPMTTTESGARTRRLDFDPVTGAAREWVCDNCYRLLTYGQRLHVVLGLAAYRMRHLIGGGTV